MDRTADGVLNLKKIRLDRGLSQARLAARADLDPSTVSQIETGARKPTPGTLDSLARALDVSEESLIGKEAATFARAGIELAGWLGRELGERAPLARENPDEFFQWAVGAIDAVVQYAYIVEELNVDMSTQSIWLQGLRRCAKHIELTHEEVKQELKRDNDMDRRFAEIIEETDRMKGGHDS